MTNIITGQSKPNTKLKGIDAGLVRSGITINVVEQEKSRLRKLRDFILRTKK